MGESSARRQYLLKALDGRPGGVLVKQTIPAADIADAQDHPSHGNWAGGVDKQYSCFGMASPLSSSGIPVTGVKSLVSQATTDSEKFHYVHAASLVYENGSVFMS